MLNLALGLATPNIHKRPPGANKGILASIAGAEPLQSTTTSYEFFNCSGLFASKSRSKKYSHRNFLSSMITFVIRLII